MDLEEFVVLFRLLGKEPYRRPWCGRSRRGEEKLYRPRKTSKEAVREGRQKDEGVGTTKNMAMQPVESHGEH